MFLNERGVDRKMGLEDASRFESFDLNDILMKNNRINIIVSKE